MLEGHFKTVFEHLNIPKSKRLGIAVSGGADSIALLSLATKWAQGSNLVSIKHPDT